MLVLLLIILHTVDGRVVEINPSQITNISGPKGRDPLFIEGTRCMINLTDGKFVAVREACNQVHKMIEENK